MVGEVVESNLLPWQCMAMVWCGGQAASRGEDGSFVLIVIVRMKGVDCGLWPSLALRLSGTKEDGARQRVKIEEGKPTK